MFVNGIAYFMSVATPLGLTMVNELGRTMGSRSVKSLRSAIQKQINDFKAYGFTIKTILTDGEGAIAALIPELQSAGIIVNPVGLSQHVPEREDSRDQRES
jgi:hypothetical protein